MRKKYRIPDQNYKFWKTLKRRQISEGCSIFLLIESMYRTWNATHNKIYYKIRKLISRIHEKTKHPYNSKDKTIEEYSLKISRRSSETSTIIYCNLVFAFSHSGEKRLEKLFVTVIFITSDTADLNQEWFVSRRVI